MKMFKELNHLAPASNSTARHYAGTWLNKPLAFVFIILCLPIWLFNFFISLVKRQSTVRQRHKIDALGRTISFREFNNGYLKSSAALVDIFLGRLSFVGVSMNHSLTLLEQKRLLEKFEAPAGLVSLFDLHESIGLNQQDPYSLLNNQLEGNRVDYLCLLLKGCFINRCFSSNKYPSPIVVTLFGLSICNLSMKQAIKWIRGNKSISPLLKSFELKSRSKIAFFINAHSINTSANNCRFKSCLSHADALFADGSGMRLAARSVGMELKANVNGTDMLPMLCEMAQKQEKSIFLLGGAGATAQRAAKNLKRQYPNLRVSGVHHGFFDLNDPDYNRRLISKINGAETDILLVGLGSPHQEFWCERHASALTCGTTLAVGGLFDYFSGDIPRAPLSFRELGLEWIWRLGQEPVVKFKRYVIGTPEFLYRTFILKQV